MQFDFTYLLSFVVLLRLLGSNTCGMCGKELSKPPATTAMICEHSFHHKCISKHLETSDQCPLCSRFVTIESIIEMGTDPTFSGFFLSVVFRQPTDLFVFGSFF